MRNIGAQITSQVRALFLSTNKQFKCQIRRYCPESFSKCDILFGKNEPFSIVDALSIAENSKSRLLGSQIHGKIIRSGLVGEVFSLNNLMKMYAKCGVLDDALQVFDEMSERNLVSWTLMVSSAVQFGEHDLSLEYFTEMVRMGFLPNSFGLGSVLKACASIGANQFGMCVHGFATKVGIDLDLYVGGSILNMYSKLEDIQSAKRVFESLPIVDAGCCNAMVGGLVKHGHGFEALTVACLMLRRGIKIDYFTFINSLKGCLVLGNLDFGKLIHGWIIKSHMKSSTSVMNCLLDVYFRLGSKTYALEVFDRILHKDVISWNTVFSHLFEEDEDDRKEIATMFREFLRGGIMPNHITFSVLLRGCGIMCDLDLGYQFYGLAIKFGLHDEVMVSNSVIYMLSRCKDMRKAHKLFDIMLVKDILTWNQLIYGYCLNNCHIVALRIFVELCGSGVKLNEFTFTSALEACFETQNQPIFCLTHGSIIKLGFCSSGHLCSLLINGYVKFRLLGDSFRFFGFDRLDFVSWATMISALFREGHICEGIRYLNSLMETGAKPDEFIFGSALNYCASISSHRLTKVFHSFIAKMGLETQAFVASGLIDAYAKSGDIDGAKKIYNKSYQLNDVVIYNTMLIGYARHGLITEAVEIIKTMKCANLRPNQSTFVSVISICNHIGLVNEGCNLFEWIISDLETQVVSRDVYGCVVDMLSRNGNLEKARRIIKEMPYAPWPEILRSFLNGCRIHGNRELGEWSSKKLVQLSPMDDAAPLLLSKIYSEIGSWDDVGKIQKNGLSKDIGYSWAEA